MLPSHVFHDVQRAIVEIGDLELVDRVADRLDTSIPMVRALMFADARPTHQQAAAIHAVAKEATPMSYDITRWFRCVWCHNLFLLHQQGVTRGTPHPRCRGCAGGTDNGLTMAMVALALPPGTEKRRGS